MKKVVAMTLFERPIEVIYSVLDSLLFPGNRPDALAVCFDRASEHIKRVVREFCEVNDLELRHTSLTDSHKGFRCPSLAWNRTFSLIEEPHVLCISSDTVLAPHTVHLGFFIAQAQKDWVIFGRAEHRGPSYASKAVFPKVNGEQNLIVNSREMTSSLHTTPLGFLWVLPMDLVNAVGGYDEVFMEGICYEDTDFVMKLWEASQGFVFVDDMLGLHIEHPRAHVHDEVAIKRNERIFKDRWGLEFGLSHGGNEVPKRVWTPDSDGASIAGWTRVELSDVDSKKELERIRVAIDLYGNRKEWRAIPFKIDDEVAGPEFLGEEDIYDVW